MYILEYFFFSRQTYFVFSINLEKKGHELICAQIHRNCMVERHWIHIRLEYLAHATRPISNCVN